MRALAATCSPDDPEGARGIIRTLATSADDQRMPLAAELFLGSRSREAQAQLAEAHWHYMEKVEDSEFEEDEEFQEFAAECLLAMREWSAAERLPRPGL